jgi:hypothetical protein
MSYNVLIYITIYFILPKPIITTIVPTIKNQIGSFGKRDATYPICSKSFWLAIYVGIL